MLVEVTAAFHEMAAGLQDGDGSIAICVPSIASLNEFPRDDLRFENDLVRSNENSLTQFLLLADSRSKLDILFDGQIFHLTDFLVKISILVNA